MHKTLIAAAAGLLALSAAAAPALAQERRYDPQEKMGMPAHPPHTMPDGSRMDAEHRMDGMAPGRYGRWNPSWGPRPGNPPRHWTRHADWYRHVHACQARYHSYNPHSDMFVGRHGVRTRCRL